MIITQNLKMDLSRREAMPRIDAVQGDALTRQIQLELYSNGTAWEIPEGVSALVRFVKPDGTGGIYDTLPDGTAACTMEGNTLWVILAPEVTAVSGAVFLAVTLIQGDAELSSFALTVNVQPNPNAELDGSVNSITLSALVKNAVEAYMEENPSKGLSEEQYQALDGMFQVTAFAADPTSAYTAFKEAFKPAPEDPEEGGEDSGEAEPVAYTVINNLTNVSSNNASVSVEENASYTAALTANEGYTVESVTVTMGGSDITEAVYSGGVVSISAVTGNVVITASAVVAEVAPLYTFTDGTKTIDGVATLTVSGNHIEFSCTQSGNIWNLSNPEANIHRTNGKGLAGQPEWFVIPAGASCELKFKNAVYTDGALSTEVSLFTSNSTVWNGTKVAGSTTTRDVISQDGTVAFTVEEETSVACLGMTCYNLGSFSFNAELYVNGIRYF